MLTRKVWHQTLDNGTLRTSFSHNASCYNGGNLPSGSPVAYGGKPAYSAGFTATHWLPYNT
ncbi:MAG: hypothetical protein V7K57_10560 [Nostoc sp.]